VTPSEGLLCVNHRRQLVEDNGGLDGALVLHGLQALAPLLELEDLVDNALNIDLA
jgi:hypothetical protein